jgi:hypothetical protein
MSQFRGSQIYVSRTTRRMLSVIARAEGVDETADAVGERLLSETVENRYPALVALQKEIEVIESRMVEAIKK